MPIYIGNIEITDGADFRVGSTQISEVYVGAERVWPDTDMPTGPTNTYSDWANSGNPFNTVETTTQGTFGPWALVSTIFSQEFQNEARTRTNVVTTTAQQRQTRTCTASGGCDGPFTRTITVTTNTRNVIDRQVRSTEGRTAGVDGSIGETVNPDFRSVFSTDDIAQFVTCSVDRNTGAVTASASRVIPLDADGNELTFSISLASDQPTSYDVIPSGGTTVSRNIGVLVSGIVPASTAGNSYANEGDNFGPTRVICTTNQLATTIRPATNLSLTVNWQDEFGRQRRLITDGATITLTGAALNSTYTLEGRSSTVGATITGEGTFNVSDLTPRRTHTVTASSTWQQH